MCSIVTVVTEEEREESWPNCHDLVVMETEVLVFITKLLSSRYDVAVETQSPEPQRTCCFNLSCFIHLLCVSLAEEPSETGGFDHISVQASSLEKGFIPGHFSG